MTDLYMMQYFWEVVGKVAFVGFVTYFSGVMAEKIGQSVLAYRKAQKKNKYTLKVPQNGGVVKGCAE